MNRRESLDVIEQNPEISVLIIGDGINGIGTKGKLGLQDLAGSRSRFFWQKDLVLEHEK